MTTVEVLNQLPFVTKGDQVGRNQPFGRPTTVHSCLNLARVLIFELLIFELWSLAEPLKGMDGRGHEARLQSPSPRPPEFLVQVTALSQQEQMHSPCCRRPLRSLQRLSCLPLGTMN